jgi:uncharacterized protein with HEPN domain
MRNSTISSRERLQHIIECIMAIDSFLQNKTKEVFTDNLVLVNATLFQFAIMGEAITHVDREILDKYPYPWHRVRSFRNFILHEYHKIEIGAVWETAKKDLSELKLAVEEVLEKEFM